MSDTRPSESQISTIMDIESDIPYEFSSSSNKLTEVLYGMRPTVQCGADVSRTWISSDTIQPRSSYARGLNRLSNYFVSIYLIKYLEMQYILPSP